MKELNEIIRAYDAAVLQDKQAALVTVVEVEGSSYRRPGARMLVTEDGLITGAISGGCLEGDALKKAQFAIFQQKNKLEIYDTTDEGDSALGVQLGCNGIVYLLFEPVKKDDPNNPVNQIRKIAQQRRDAVLVTRFNKRKSGEQVGTCGFVSGVEIGVDASILEDAKTVLSKKQSLVKHEEGSSVLFQFAPPSLQLVVAGAGNDVQPLADMAFLLGWHVVIADGRPAYATQQRFPRAVVTVTRPGDILSAATLDEQTAVILMTHNYGYDIAALKQVITTNCPYIGVLGPKKKLHKMIEALAEDGIKVTDAMLQCIHGPVGLDIGAETAEEIALSVTAEIQAVFSRRCGGSLKEKQADIHNRTLPA